MSIFGTLLATLIYDSVVWHVVKDDKRRNRLEARLPRQARTPIFPNYDDAQYNDNRNGAEMAGQITYRIITGEFYGFLRRRFFVSGFAFFDEERREAGGGSPPPRVVPFANTSRGRRSIITSGHSRRNTGNS
jgi:hypothetical protein